MSRMQWFSTQVQTHAGVLQIRIVSRSLLQLGSNLIRLSKFFLGADQGIKMNSEQLIISIDQCIFSDAREAWQCFCPSPHKIKRSRASEGNDQAIKDNSRQSSFLISVANTTMGLQTLLWATSKILPLMQSSCGRALHLYHYSWRKWL